MAGSVFDLFARLLLDTKPFEEGLDGAKGKATGVGNGIGNAIKGGMKVVAGAVAAGTAAITAFGAASVKDGMTFDAAMSQVKAISGASAEQFDQLREKAIEMGAQTKFSATESAEAFNYMAMAGWKPIQMMEGISGVMNLAAASGEDLALTSDIVTDAITAFGMAAGDSGHFADTLAAAAANSNTNVSMLGEAFKYAAPVVGAMFKEVEDGSSIAETTAVALGVMANSGIKASMGGTALRSVFSRLAKPTKETQQAMDALGISLQDDSGHAYTMMEVLEQIRNGFKNNLQIPADEAARQLNELNAQLEAGTITEKEYDAAVEGLTERAFGATGALNAQYAAMLAGKPAMSGLLAIVSASDEDWDKLTSSIQNSSEELAKLEDGSIVPLSQAMAEGSKVMEIYKGQAEAMARMMNDNLAGDITILKSNLETLHIAISDVLTPSLRNFVQFATSGIAQVTTAFRQDGLQGAIQALGPVIEQGIQLLFSSLPRVLEAATSLLTFFVSAIVQNLPTLIPAGIQIITMLGTALIQGFPMLLESASNIITQIADGIMQVLPMLAPAALQIIQQIAQSIEENLPTILTVTVALIQAFVTGIADAIPLLTPAAIQILQQIVQSVIENLPSLIDAALQIITALSDFLIEALPQLIPAIVQIFLTIVEKLTDPDTLTQLVTAALQIIIALANGLIEALPKLIEAVPTIIENLTAAIIQNLPAIIAAGIQIIMSLQVGIIQMIPQLVELAPKLLIAVANGITQSLGKIVEVGKQLVEGFKKGISDAWNGLVSSAKKLFTDFISLIKGIFGIHSPSTVFANIGQNLLAGFLKGISEKVSSITETVRNLKESISNIFQGLADAAASWGRDLIGGFVDGLQEKLQALKDKAVSIAQQIKDVIGFSEPKEGPLSNFHTYAPDMMELWAKGIKDNEHLVTDAITNAADFGGAVTAAGFSSGAVVGTGGGRSIAAGPRMQTIILQVGRTELARLVHELNSEEDERIGLKLVTA